MEENGRKIKLCSEYTYLGVIMLYREAKLNLVVRRNKETDRKRSIVQSIVTYGLETWKII